LQEECNSKVDVDDTGVVTISSSDAVGAEACRDRIQALCDGPQVGKIYQGKVISIKDFGAFVELTPGQDGLVHISEMSDGYVGSVSEIAQVGDQMLVKVIAIDDQDRVKLSRRAALAERGIEDPAANNPRPAGAPDRGPGGPPRPPRREGDRGPDRREGGGGPPRRRDGY
jgi:polyribonucleotide nucleotidyltransferase